jgi:hypothetical protein
MRVTNYPRKPQSGKQAGRYRLPHWLKGSVDELLRVHLAIGVARPEAAVDPGADADDRVIGLVSDATPELRARCREYLLGHALAPHAQWQPEASGEPTATPKPPTVADLEARLAQLADDGDRAAILAMLAALDPARYGPPGRTVADSPDTVDVVDWVPAVVTQTERK